VDLVDLVDAVVVRADPVVAVPEAPAVVVRVAPADVDPAARAVIVATTTRVTVCTRT